MRSSGHRVAGFAAAIATSIMVSAALAQPAYPHKPIRAIVPYPPGGTADTVARLLGPKFTEAWGQPVIVDNRPGGNTIIGTEALARANPDGYTIMVMVVAHVIIPNLLRTPYDAIKDFAPVGTISVTEQLLVVNAGLPVNGLQELIAFAKAKPAQLNYGSAGSGGLTHLVSEFFNVTAGVKTTHIPYKGAGPAVADLVGGQIQMYFATPVSVVAHVKGGRLKPIAITGEARSAMLPQVPTFTEAGLPGFEVKNWNGVLAPAGTPDAIVARLSNELARILRLPDINAKLVGQGLEPYITTPAAFGALMRSDLAKYAKIIRVANIKLESG